MLFTLTASNLELVITPMCSKRYSSNWLFHVSATHLLELGLHQIGNGNFKNGANATLTIVATVRTTEYMPTLLLFLVPILILI
jgi:hypothetical protein